MEHALERLGPERVAAFFVEPVISAGGVYPPSDGYIDAVADVCRQAGVLLIIDAVICAFGRLGTWFGIERWGVEPDMIVFAKGVTATSHYCATVRRTPGIRRAARRRSRTWTYSSARAW